MASLPRTDNQGRFLFQRTNPSFFKIIIDLFLELGKMRLPRKFISEYGDDLLDHSLFKVPSGEVWKMWIDRSESPDVWIGRGWRDFARYYSLVHGSLIIFEFDKRSKYFNVKIFNRSGSEVLYPYRIMNADAINGLNIDDNFEVEATNVGFENNEEVEDLVPRERRKGKEIATESSRRHETPKIKRRPPLKNSALSRAAATFNSSKPFFIIEMQATYVYLNYMLCVPSKFGRKYFRENGIYAFLCVQGRKYRVTYYWVEGNGRGKVRIYKGWKEFVQQNALKIGDALAFELVEESHIVFNVVIYRVDEGRGKDNAVDHDLNNVCEQGSKDKGKAKVGPSSSKHRSTVEEFMLVSDSESEFESNSDYSDESDESYVATKSLFRRNCKRKIPQ